MKLRIRGNSLRLRLTQGEVASLRAEGAIAEKITFPAGNSLEYRLRTAAEVADCQAEFDGERLTVTLPAAVAIDWADSDTVTIESLQASASGADFLILVEKDFACLAERPHEDDSDAFPHPQG